jgi:hypothetical protein
MRTKIRGSTFEAQKLRELAGWYRGFAERARSSVISESRLLMAADLEKEADLLEQDRPGSKNARAPLKLTDL